MSKRLNISCILLLSHLFMMICGLILGWESRNIRFIDEAYMRYNLERNLNRLKK